MESRRSMVRRKPADQPVTPDMAIPAQVGYWSALIVTIIGTAYMVVIGILFATGGMTLPPAEWVQLFAALVTIASGPLLVAALAAVHYTVPADRRLLSLLGVLFAAVFMVMVSINRFVQLGVVRISTIKGNTGGLERFMPYGEQSAMLTLEMVGWGFFLGLALLCAGLALSSTQRERLVRWTFLTYGVLAITSTVAFVADSPLSMIGFVAWGVVLPVGTAFLAAHFHRMGKQA